MHPPVDPSRPTGTPLGPRPSGRAGAGDRASLDRFRLRRGLQTEDLAAYAAARLAALEEAARRTTAGPVWRPLGPFAVPHGWTAGSGPGSRPRVAGRVAAVAVDPGDPAHLLAGAGAGGVWETRDGGRSWRPRTDDQPSTAIGAVAFAPADPAVAYAGTGEDEALAALGVGLLRSGDGGATWRLLAAGELFGVGFSDLLVDPGDPGRLLAATTAGLWASADGGDRWERRLAGRSWAVSAGADGELLAGGEHGLHRSTDGGVTWRPVPLPSAPAAFDRVAVAHAAGGQVAYVFAAGEGVGHLWRRELAGGPFEQVKPPADLRSRHAWRSWACAVDPGDPEVVWLGAYGLHRGTRGADGRWSWVDLAARPSGDSLPPAQHAVVFDPGDPGSVWVANDGGLFHSPDGGRSWRSLNTGLAITEVDHLADHPGGTGWLIAAAGQLGPLRYEGTEVWFPADPDELGPLRDEGGGERFPAGTGAGGGLPAVAVSAMAHDPDRPGTVFAATDAGVWRSLDGGAGWQPFGRGLPAAPALALAVHRPARLLRVGLLGRGVWELTLDAGPGPAAAAPFLRASRAGAVRSGPGARGWWECPDVKVELPPGAGTEPVGPVEFEDDRGPWATGLQELGGRVLPGRPARVNVQVHHRGEAPLRGVRVRVLAVPACLRPPELPGGAWLLEGDPPPGSPWRAVGPPATVGDLDPGRSKVAGFDWEVPADMTGAVCLLAFATAGGPGVTTAGDPAHPDPGDPGGVGGVDPAELVAGDGRWGLKQVTVLGPDPGGGLAGPAPVAPGRVPGGRRVVRLELWGAAGRGPFRLAAEPWVAGLAAGLVLGRRLGGLAREAGLVPGRVAEPWRPGLVALVQEDPALAERLDLAAAFPLPAVAPPDPAPGPAADPSPGPGTDPVVWLDGLELAPDQAEPLLVLLHDPPPTGGGALLLIDADGRVAGGHTLQAPGGR